MSEQPYSEGPPQLRHQVNPCDMDRFAPLAPIGDMVAAGYELLTRGTECPCCLGFRVLAFAGVAACAGFVLGVWLT